jgi:hypothetical protein
MNGSNPAWFKTARVIFIVVSWGELIRERDPAVVRLSNSWIVTNSAGGPTDDKPDVVADSYSHANRKEVLRAQLSGSNFVDVAPDPLFTRLGGAH